VLLALDLLVHREHLIQIKALRFGHLYIAPILEVRPVFRFDILDSLRG
jgi:hypothetical protein